jgi:hypothetical protein
MLSSSNDFHDLCTAIGMMTLSWAWAENILAATIGVINRYAGPIKGFPEAPLSLKKKVACLKIALRDISALQCLSNDGRVLAELFKELSLRRNKFIHGACRKLLRKFRLIPAGKFIDVVGRFQPIMSPSA